MVALGHEHVDDWRDSDVRFVFVGNGPFDAYLDAARARSKPFIFNVLDIAVQNPSARTDIETFRAHLPIAQRVTAISEFTQWQVQHHVGLESDVIYYPMKPVFATNVKTYPEIKVMICGRINDANKRVASAVSALVRAGYESADVHMVGPERPSWGTYHGVVSDERLNDMYNSADYVMMLSRVEGLGLPGAEAACVGAIPIVAPDLTTYRDFWADSPMHPHYQTFTSLDAIASFIKHMDAHPDEKAAMKTAMLAYGTEVLRPKLDRVQVARRILDVAARFC